MIDIPPKLITLTSAMLLFQTSIPPWTDVISPVERLTLIGALVVAVRVLWVSNSRKDEQLVAMAAKVTETMALVLVAVQELRGATERIGKSMDSLSDKIAILPCSVMEHEERLRH